MATAAFKRTDRRSPADLSELKRKRAHEKEMRVREEKKQVKRRKTAEENYEQMSKEDLIALHIEKDKERRAIEERSCLGTHFSDLPDRLRAEQFGFGSMEEVRKLSDEVLPFCSNTGNSELYDHFTVLRATLYLLRRGGSFTMLHHLIPPKHRSTASSGDPTRTTRRWVRNMISSLRKWGEGTKQIRLLNPKEWLADTKHASGNFAATFPGTLIYHVDGTLLKGLKPFDASVANTLFNSKHAAHGWQVFVIVSQMGRIVYLSSVEGGKLHDKTHWQRDGVPDVLYSYYNELKSYNSGEVTLSGRTYQCAIGGDKAYKCLQLPEGWKLFVTKSGENHDVDEEQRAHDRGVSYSGKGGKKDKKKKKKKNKKKKTLPPVTEKGTPLTVDMEVSQEFCPKIAKYRSVVERVMAALKRWHILTTPELLSGNTVEDIIFVVACLTNYQLKKFRNKKNW
tara:strand:- start:108 stop:1463 length:1356 start_codon:yes stop_codon:yes gene_type:complete